LKKSRLAAGFGIALQSATIRFGERWGGFGGSCLSVLRHWPRSNGGAFFLQRFFLAGREETPAEVAADLWIGTA